MMPGGASNTGDGFSPASEDDFGHGLGEDLRARAKSELEPGERLLWAARSSPPPQSVGIGHVVAGGIALVLVVAGLAIIVLEINRSRVPFNRESPLPLGIAIGAIGAVIAIAVIGSWISSGQERRRRERFCYAITDRRAIAWVPEPNGDAVRIHSLPRGNLNDVIRIERPDGSGSLEFVPRKDCNHYFGHTDWIKDVPDVRRVEQIVRNYLIPNESTT
jgi:hypothetical protein